MSTSGYHTVSSDGFLDTPTTPTYARKPRDLKDQEGDTARSDHNANLLEKNQNQKDSEGTTASSLSITGDREGSQPLFAHLHEDEQSHTIFSVFSVLEWWLPELASSVLSVACLLCIVIVLRIYEGRVATDLRLPNSLTLNGLIAFIATINRASLTTPICSATMQEMWLYFASEAKKPVCKSRLRDLDLFANASVGTWGSLIFILRARGSRLLACMGCLITILSLAYSTFTQQLIVLSLQPTSNSTFTSNIPRSETWANWGGTEFDALSSFDPGLTMIGALYSGVLVEGISPVEVYCPTGNCTWPLSPSMAVCGACAPSTFQRLDCPTDSSCNIALPSGSITTMTNFWNLTQGNQSQNGSTARFQAVPGRGAVFNSSLQDRLYIMNVDLFGAPYWSFADSSPPLTNTECALWMCVQTYKTTMNSSVMHQEVIGTYDTIEAKFSNLNISGLAFNGGTYYEFPPLPEEFVGNNQTRFTVDLWAYLALQQYMYQAMQGTVYWSASQPFSNDLMRGIWNGTTNPHRWIENLATSLSNVVRSTNTSSRPQYDGTALGLTIKVRWEWLVLPAALVLLSIVFLIVVMIRTAYSPVQSWKGSPLTFLLFSVDEDTKRLAYGQVDRCNGVQKAIGRTRARLVKGEGGIRKFHAS